MSVSKKPIDTTERLAQLDELARLVEEMVNNYKTTHMCVTLQSDTDEALSAMRGDGRQERSQRRSYFMHRADCGPVGP